MMYDGKAQGPHKVWETEESYEICEAIPGAIVDFDITEGERAVGLAFLEAGGSPEIHEKIFTGNGRGAVVIFYNYRNVWRADPANSLPGEFTYTTENHVDKKHWANPGTDVTSDDRGRAVITAKFTGPGAKIVFFGVD